MTWVTPPRRASEARARSRADEPGSEAGRVAGVRRGPALAGERTTTPVTDDRLPRAGTPVLDAAARVAAQLDALWT